MQFRSKRSLPRASDSDLRDGEVRRRVVQAAAADARLQAPIAGLREQRRLRRPDAGVAGRRELLGSATDTRGGRPIRVVEEGAEPDVEYLAQLARRRLHANGERADADAEGVDREVHLQVAHLSRRGVLTGGLARRLAQLAFGGGGL